MLHCWCGNVAVFNINLSVTNRYFLLSVISRSDINTLAYFAENMEILDGE